MPSLIGYQTQTPVYRQNWPLQLGQPLREIKYTQQQCKCNHRQIGSEPTPPHNQQMG